MMRNLRCTKTTAPYVLSKLSFMTGHFQLDLKHVSVTEIYDSAGDDLLEEISWIFIC